MKAPKIALVIPCFNEEAVIVSSVHTLSQILSTLISEFRISPDSFLLAVNDGSTDRTLDLLKICKEQFPLYTINLSKNAGHQNALLSGLHYLINKVDCCISLDADLQDDPAVITKMIAEYKGGYEIVYGVRSDRSSDTYWKRTTAKLFYQLSRGMGVPLVSNHADFRLMSNRALVELSKYRESNLFLRGIIPLLGFSSSTVYYKRNKRQGGISKYPFFKMLKFAMNGIASFSSYPLRLITTAGILISIACLGFSAWVVVVMVQGKNIPGWASITLPLYFLGGIQLLAIGILGEYISRIYIETKRRPHYHVDEVIEPVDWKESPFEMTRTNLSFEKQY